jgi:hypothetical protein
MTQNSQGPSFAAQCLGFGGLIPFVGLAVVLWLVPSASQPLWATALLGYGATICSFLGAIHWGLTMRDGPAPRTSSLLWGVIPSLLSWVALTLGAAPGLLLIVVTLCACFAVDRLAYPRAQLHAWLPMRFQLTLVAGLGCLAGVAALKLS